MDKPLNFADEVDDFVRFVIFSFQTSNDYGIALTSALKSLIGARDSQDKDSELIYWAALTDLVEYYRHERLTELIENDKTKSS